MNILKITAGVIAIVSTCAWTVAIAFPKSAPAWLLFGYPIALYLVGGYGYIRTQLSQQRDWKKKHRYL